MILDHLRDERQELNPAHEPNVVLGDEQAALVLGAIQGLNLANAD